MQTGNILTKLGTTSLFQTRAHKQIFCQAIPQTVVPKQWPPKQPVLTQIRFATPNSGDPHPFFETISSPRPISSCLPGACRRRRLQWACRKVPGNWKSPRSPLGVPCHRQLQCPLSCHCCYRPARAGPAAATHVQIKKAEVGERRQESLFQSYTTFKHLKRHNPAATPRPVLGCTWRPSPFRQYVL